MRNEKILRKTEPDITLPGMAVYGRYGSVVSQAGNSLFKTASRHRNCHSYHCGGFRHRLSHLRLQTPYPVLSETFGQSGERSALCNI